MTTEPTNEQVAELEEKFVAKLQAGEGYGKPVVLPPGDKVTPLAFPPEEFAITPSEVRAVRGRKSR